jgi:hypothetical protein
MSLAPWVATRVMSEDTPSPLAVALRLVDLYGAVHVEESYPSPRTHKRRGNAKGEKKH